MNNQSREFKITPVKTYASYQNARKAVEKKGFQNERHFIMEDLGRFYPVFIGERAIERGIHFHFNVIG